MPPVATESQPIRYEGSQQTAGPGAYVFTVGFLAFLAFVLGNVNADRELDLDLARVEDDLRWAAALAIVYWVQSLLSRTTVIDPRARWDVNAGYNTREITILAALPHETPAPSNSASPSRRRESSPAPRSS